MSIPSTPSRQLVELAKAYALSEFYPLSHPTLTQAVLTLAQSLLTAGQHFHLRVDPMGSVLVAGGHAPRSAHVDRFAARLREHGVSTVVLRHDIGAESLGRFLSAAALPPRVARAAGGLSGALAAAGASRVQIDGAWVQPAAPALAAAGAVADSAASGGGNAAVDVGIEMWSAHDMYEQVRESAVRVEHEDTEELRRLLREGTDSERLEVLGRLEFLAQYCLNRGMMDRGIRLVQDLRRDAEELRARSPHVRSMVMLAIHRVSTRPVIEELVQRLGKARSEEERTGLRSTLLHVGADTVTPLVRELVAATDVSARRAYRDALVALDHVGVPLLEDMVGDERWFVVRNMVGILGEIRSADAIEHFRRTIEHSDARVRRETVLALSKIGGEEAVPLLAKGLNDSESALRGAAALGLGLTKLSVAVGPLLNRLPQENDPEVEVEIVRALGRVGDPRAVPVLAERAAGGGFFSRVPAPIRVEATRALGEIGGDAARAVLQRLLRERNAEVREAAVKALG
ncbi:HEAT repeat domain-containing protein [Longimicrobium sp.]|uniref:HEAT repeat domain-containing protein n=1 Tax=Longimicrobium sp. TaxID=2029185 RepID=UPI002E30C420|nr:HEAT repeat domain-containing protein [Longimicrobium sp.]HEX6039816.1 HEAT repeat domain-containing protein [Longimicrobium sp.]